MIELRKSLTYMKSGIRDPVAFYSPILFVKRQSNWPAAPSAFLLICYIMLAKNWYQSKSPQHKCWQFLRRKLHRVRAFMHNTYMEKYSRQHLKIRFLTPCISLRCISQRWESFQSNDVNFPTPKRIYSRNCTASGAIKPPQRQSAPPLQPPVQSLMTGLFMQ